MKEPSPNTMYKIIGFCSCAPGALLFLLVKVIDVVTKQMDDFSKGIILAIVLIVYWWVTGYCVCKVADYLDGG